MPDASAVRTPTPSAHGGAPGVVTGIVIILSIVGLYLGRDIFIPFALAVLLSFMLAPLVTRLQRWGLYRVPAVICVVTVAFALLGGLSVLVGNQVFNLAQNLPGYQDNIQKKIQSFRANTTGGGVIERAVTMFENLSREVSGANPSPSAAAPRDSAPPREPLPVRIEQPSQPLMAIEQVLTWLAPIGTAGIVVVFVIFILLERDDLRDRFIRLVGKDLHRTTEALNEAARRVSRYLLMQLVVNATYGVPIGLGLYLIGVPNAFLWGLLATLLRFVPYLGPFIAALFPLVLAFAVDPGWSMLLWTVALLLGMELISNNVIEPWLYGASTGLSSVAVILAAIFWTTLWGPIGLVLATPLTVCLVVMGRYVPQLQFLGVLLGSEPVLTPAEQFYQRLLAGNTEEAVDLAEAYVEKKSTRCFYDEVSLPALRLAETDRHEGDLGTDGRKSVAKGVLAVVRELASEAKEGKPGAPSRQADGADTAVLCIAGRGEHDRAAASMLAHLLEERGIGARVLPSSTITPDAIGQLDLTGVEVVVVSYLHPSPQPFARYVCRRLRRSAPGVKLLVACWTPAPDEGSLEAVATNVGADAIVSSLGIALKRVEEVASGAIKCAPMAAPIPVDEEARLQALHASGLLEARSGGHLDRIASRLAKTFETPIALVTLVDESCQIWKGSVGLSDDLGAAGQAPRETSICGHVVAIEKPLVVEDTLRDPRFANNSFLRTHGIRFYAGAPLRTPCDHIIGSLCVIDTKPRTITSREVELLQVIADELMANTPGDRDLVAAGPDAGEDVGLHPA